MSDETIDESDPRMEAALDELRGLILAVYPTASFRVSREEDPDGIYLRATVDIDDAETVVDVVSDRLLELQIEEGLPVYVVPIEPLGRVLAQMDAGRAMAGVETRAIG